MRPLLLTFAPIVILGACAKNGDEGFVILNNSTAAQGTTCVLTGMPGQPFTASGTISTISPSGYLASPLVQSNITAMSGQEAQRTIFLEGAIVQLSVPTQPSMISLSSSEAAFRVPASASLPPNGGTVNVSFDLVPESVIQKVAALGGTSTRVEVDATVTMFGQLAGDTIQALPWQYSVTVCNDCVVNNAGPCPVTTTVRTGNPCNPFQDGIVDCCTNGTTLVCPAMQ
jgi:hypothetical protein